MATGTMNRNWNDGDYLSFSNIDIQNDQKKLSYYQIVGMNYRSPYVRMICIDSGSITQPFPYLYENIVEYATYVTEEEMLQIRLGW